MKIKVGIIGLGHWGSNYVRNFVCNKDTEVAWGCDLSAKVLESMTNFYPFVKLTNDYTDLLKDGSLNLIAVATTPETHFEIAKKALLANKHVLVAKPITIRSKQTLELIKLAKRRSLLLQGDLTFLYTSSIRTIKKFLNSGGLGKPLYYDSTRSNLGLIQKDVNVIWDLAIHDLAIIAYLFNLKPKRIFAVASKHIGNSKREEMAHITINYEKKFVGHIHVSWISPVKIRNILIGGAEKMIVFNDVEPDEKVKIYDRGVEVPPGSVTALRPLYRSGDVLIPKLETEEALFVEINEVVNQIISKNIIYDNAIMNAQLIKLLEACDISLEKNCPVPLDTIGFHSIGNS